MAVPNSTETRCRDGMQDMLYKDYTTNPIPTSFFGSKIALSSNLVA